MFTEAVLPGWSSVKSEPAMIDMCLAVAIALATIYDKK